VSAPFALLHELLEALEDYLATGRRALRLAPLDDMAAALAAAPAEYTRGPGMRKLRKDLRWPCFLCGDERPAFIATFFPGSTEDPKRTRYIHVTLCGGCQQEPGAMGRLEQELLDDLRAVLRAHLDN
jgi:hypothetical protein